MKQTKHGGNRKGAGRKPKANEIDLVEALSPLDAIAFKALEKGVKAGNFHYIKLFLEYRYGKPKQLVDLKAKVENDDNTFRIEIIPPLETDE